jgi:hypothetical protein
VDAEDTIADPSVPPSILLPNPHLLPITTTLPRLHLPDLQLITPPIAQPRIDIKRPPMPRTRNPRTENYPKILNIIQTPPRQRMCAVRTAVVNRVQFVPVPKDKNLWLEAYGLLGFGGCDLAWWLGVGELEDCAWWRAVGWVGGFGDFGFGGGGGFDVGEGGGEAGVEPFVWG